MWRNCCRKSAPWIAVPSITTRATTSTSQLRACCAWVLSACRPSASSQSWRCSTSGTCPSPVNYWLKDCWTSRHCSRVCLGIRWAAAADTRNFQAMVDQLPPGANWAGFGVGAMEMPMVAQAVLLGGNVRVGLEDNLYLETGVFASNAQLVERACQIVDA